MKVMGTPGKIETYKAQIGNIAEQFDNFELWKKDIIFCLINKEQNQKLLEECPFVPFLDLAVVFILYIYEQGEYRRILLRKEHLKIWGVTVDTLYQLARENTPRLLPADAAEMQSIMKEMFGEIESLKRTPKMLILGNSKSIYGAAVLLYDRLLEELANRLQSDFLVLPSSVHEVLVLPYQREKKWDLEVWKRTVLTANQEYMLPEERLSEHVYVYSREKGKLEIAV